MEAPRYIYFLYLSLLLLLSQVGFAQNPDIKRTWHWYFGYNSGLDFSTGVAMPDTTGHLYTFEGCASISDTLGNLLFYTDGDTVWDKFHFLMTNGTGLLGCGNYGSTAQATVIIPYPGNTNLFYIITNDCGENLCVNGLNYSIVDMTLNGGNGDVTNKNVLLFAPGMEALATVKHCNNSFYWLVSHQYGNNNFMVFLIDSSGISGPNIYSIGTSYNYYYGWFRFSSDGNKLATAFYNILPYNELFDFDTETGIISNKIQLNGYGGEYCPEFSYDNSKLYYTTSGNILYQYDISSNDETTINNTKIVIANTPDNSMFRGLAKGPDGKIYISPQLRDSMSTIDSSNNYGLACNLNIFNSYLINPTVDIPNFPSNFFLNSTPTVTCTTGLQNLNNTSINISVSNAIVNIKGNRLRLIYLFNIMGEVMLIEKINGEPSAFLDLTHLPQSVYVLKITDSWQTIIKKIILN